jgi:hypothetical protein
VQQILDFVLWLGERFGYVIGSILVVFGIFWLIGLFSRRLDDGFQWIGDSAPPPPRTSPFLTRADNGESGRSSAAGEVKQ